MKPGSCVLHLFGLKILDKNRICCHGLPFPNYSYFVLSMIIICMNKKTHAADTLHLGHWSAYGMQIFAFLILEHHELLPFSTLFSTDG